MYSSYSTGLPTWVVGIMLQKEFGCMSQRLMRGLKLTNIKFTQATCNKVNWYVDQNPNFGLTVWPVEWNSDELGETWESLLMKEKCNKSQLGCWQFSFESSVLFWRAIYAKSERISCVKGNTRLKKLFFKSIRILTLLLFQFDVWVLKLEFMNPL